MKRRTKIIATLGPATDAPEVLTALLDRVDVVRINFSHAQAERHIQRIQAVRETAKKLNKVIGIIGDLQGPKIRIKQFQEGQVHLQKGKTFILDTTLEQPGDHTRVGLDYKALVQDVKVGDTLLLDDGKIELSVTAVTNTEVICRIMTTAVLSNNKGINRLGGGLSAHCLTEKDQRDIDTALKANVDYVAVSFPRNADDILSVKKRIDRTNPNVNVIAKIERAEALEVIEQIIHVSDAVMVARGDLGVEIGVAAVPSVQKHIIQTARNLNKVVITATQMMESMITETVPTRAEVSDVANAVLDGTDAVMLSAETAVGKYPIKVVDVMNNVCLSAEQNPISLLSGHRLEDRFERVDEAIAMATMYTANHLKIKAIIALTELGLTTLYMSRIRSGIPIFGLSRHQATLQRMTLYRGVYPLSFDPTSIDRKEVNTAAVNVLLQNYHVQENDHVILTQGDAMGAFGGTNTMKIVTVGDVA